MKCQKTEEERGLSGGCCKCPVGNHIPDFENCFQGLLYPAHTNTHHLFSKSTLVSLFQHNWDIHCLQRSQHLVCWEVHPPAHTPMYMCTHPVSSWFCECLPENTQPFILLKPDLSQTYVLCFNFSKFQSLSLSTCSCPVSLPPSVLETQDIYKLYRMSNTSQRASL